MPVSLKHPRAIRWFHWLNVPLLSVMIWSGSLIYWADDFYRFPQSFYEALSIPGRLAEGMAFHFLFMWLFAINGLAYAIYLAVSGEWRSLAPRRGDLRGAMQVFLHDLRISKRAPDPRGKLNPAQRLSYSGVILMGAGSLVTGLAIYKPVQLSWLTAALGGYPAARVEHFWLTVGYLLFVLVHVVQVARAGWNNLRAMVSGYELR